jgi:hypothetical protein
MSRPAGTHLLWREVGPVLVIAHGRAAPSDEGWRELVVAASAPLANGRRAPRVWAGVLIYSLGGMPTVTQRARLGQWLSLTGAVPPIALVSDSPLARGVLTAVRWLFPTMRAMHAFALEQKAAALQSLGLEAALQARVDAALGELLGELGR